MQIARELNSIDKALQWTDLAPDQLDKIMSYEIHKRTEPEAFSKASRFARYQR